MSPAHPSAGDSADPLASLRDALALSPQNVPLRLHVAESLLQADRATEAEAEFKAGLALAPDHAGLKLGLARAFHRQGKYSHALVVVEDLLQQAEKPAAAYVLHARLLFQAGDVPGAVRAYRWGIEASPALADPELAARLGVQASPERSEVVEGRLTAGWAPEPPPPSVELERPALSFTDVGGMEELKEEIRLKIIHPLRHPELYQAYGKKTGGGLLMYGPPGCGKTYLARATAGEIQAGFLAVGIHEILDMWIGNSERNLHEVFEHARAHAPCVLFFDEVDALGASRADLRQSAGRMLINQFLSELDGATGSNEGVLVLGATNAPWHLDAAFRRPGRFDRILFVPPPDPRARASILRVHAAGKPAEDLDFDRLARKTDHFSGADLRAVVELAVEKALSEALRTGVSVPLTTQGLLEAATRQKATTREWFATARNYALYSNQGGLYDDILTYLKLP